MSRKNIVLIAGAFCFLVVLLIAGAVIIISQRNNMPTTNTVSGPANFFRNFQMQTGQIISRDDKSFVLDGNTGQFIVTWDTQTQIRKQVPSDKNTVIQVGNTVNIRLSDTDSSTATSIVKFEQQFASAPVDQNGPRQFNGRGGNGGQRQGMLRFLIGTITAINGDKITIKARDNDQEINIAGAAFAIDQKGSDDDLQAGAKVQVIGVTSNEKLAARQITIQ